MNITSHLLQTLQRRSSTVQTLCSIQAIFADRDYYYHEDLLIRCGKIKAPVKSYLFKLMILEMQVATYATNNPRLTKVAYVIYRSQEIIVHLHNPTTVIR